MTDPTTGDLLVTGLYDPDGPIDILGTTLQPPAQPGSWWPSFIARFGPDGTVKSATGPYPTILSFLVTPSGDIVVAGHGDGTYSIGGEAPLGYFLGKLNGTGTLDWFRSCACDLASGMLTAFAKDGNLLFFSSFKNTIDWLDDGTSFTSAGKADFLLSKLDLSNGQILWTKRFGDVNDDLSFGLAVDPAGNILVTGIFDGNLTHIGTMTAPSDGQGGSAVLGKLSPSGEAEWVVVLKGPDEQGIDTIAAGPQGEVVATGVMYGASVQVNDTTSTDATLPGTGNQDLFVLKLNAAGEYQWGRALGTNWGMFSSLAVGENGDVFGAGTYSGTADLGGGPLPMTAGPHGFVGRLSSDGTHVWSKDFGSVTGIYMTRLALDSTKLSLVTTPYGSVDFGDGPHISVGEDVAVAVIGR